MIAENTGSTTPAGYVITGRLHTDVLKDVYGPIGVQVLHDDNALREILLTDQYNIARTYAMTVKNAEWTWDSEMQTVNESICNGEAIGKAFQAAGFAICKNIVDVYLVTLPEWLQHAFAHSSMLAKARISEFLVKKNQIVFNYGLITEIYSPDFREPVIHAQDLAQVNLPSWVLYDMGLTKQQMWKYVEKRARQQQDSQDTISVVAAVKEKVRRTLSETVLMMAV